ncbi:MAG TPA: peptide chain release factor N(5)-glutamine methyltransferase [Candidatus Limnocylindrales bacterium]|nr:peptide chain release factor N(5)-glutamine methyltransferase [Candidatus Limnocylindrales bacterium]
MTATRALVEAGTERFRAAGSETPRLDAELLLAYAIGVDRTAVIAHGEAPVGSDAEAAYEALVSRREMGEPVAYLRGMKEFHGIALTVDPRALIPRPETELLVDIAISTVMTALTAGVVRQAVPRVVDVGTGSGAIAIALAVALRARRVPAEDLEITAVDVSPDALELARENAVAHGVGDRLRFVASDLLPPNARSEPVDIVVANLPYVRTAELESLIERRLSAAFEPRVALDGGPDGLAVIRRLLDELSWGLAIDGVALLEIGGDQGPSALELVSQHLPDWTGETLPDLAGLPRVLRLRRRAT